MEEEIEEQTINEGEQEGFVDPEAGFPIDQIIAARIELLEEEGKDIVVIDFASIKKTYDSIKDITTIKKLTLVPDLYDSVVNAINMFDEEIKSTSSSGNFLKIAKSLFSNTEVDYYKIFESVE